MDGEHNDSPGKSLLFELEDITLKLVNKKLTQRTDKLSEKFAFATQTALVAKDIGSDLKGLGPSAELLSVCVSAAMASTGAAAVIATAGTVLAGAVLGYKLYQFYEKIKSHKKNLVTAYNRIGTGVTYISNDTDCANLQHNLLSCAKGHSSMKDKMVKAYLDGKNSSKRKQSDFKTSIEQAAYALGVQSSRFDTKTFEDGLGIGLSAGGKPIRIEELHDSLASYRDGVISLKEAILQAQESIDGLFSEIEDALDGSFTARDVAGTYGLALKCLEDAISPLEETADSINTFTLSALMQ